MLATRLHNIHISRPSFIQIREVLKLFSNQIPNHLINLQQIWVELLCKVDFLLVNLLERGCDELSDGELAHV